MLGIYNARELLKSTIHWAPAQCIVDFNNNSKILGILTFTGYILLTGASPVVERFLFITINVNKAFF